MPSSADSLLDHVYGALADPTRRAILAALARGEMQVGALAERFPISFNGVSKHVKVLERAGLVSRRVVGREHWLSAEPAPLLSAAQWIDHYRAFWTARLDALDALFPPPASANMAAEPTRSRRKARARGSSKR